MSRESLEQFKEVLLKYTTLQERLKATADTESFVKLAVKLGEESGYSFTAEEVKEALQEETERLAKPPTIEDVVARFKIVVNYY
ncbi:Nif11 family protein [Planktothrix sp. FACHB-1355]|uniref:Nif11 family protein n=1 Tax=Aerosakkonema funiforme FACHB-1375 TaxID=2949571 RepID=A0A926VG70_9CYAN|nr:MULTISPECIES: Nif11-like leader peptide family natural product precursor [Oscillatoriales]MBD2183401.1 Nif11 family protein [Aerosakkonema funiforme FACHB-1375]MBD3557495.1 Nif11 family protein [Planktothrix sp. FACHB-1355]